jgi:peptidoglycan/xylan/chitin deacetylase (PgdA/CDA1 family)
VRSIWLMYHDVHANGRPAGVPRTAAVYHLSVDTLRRHLAAIRASGLPVLTAAESLSPETAAAAGDHAVITFDDGWEGSLSVGLECLLEAGVRATYFVTRDHVGKPRFASADQLVEAHRHGMEIGSHGTTHRLLAGLPEPQVRSELEGSMAFLGDLVGSRIVTGSVPGGSWSRTVSRAARDCGYIGLCTSRPGVNRDGDDPFRIRRLPVRSRTGVGTIERWAQFLVTGELLQSGLRRIPRRVLGEQRYVGVRRRLLRASKEQDVVRPANLPGSG